MHVTAWPVLLGLTGILTACNFAPEKPPSMLVSDLSDRAMQSRRYESTDEERILIASAGVLQDLGFLIDESDPGLGLISGSKMRSARESSQVATSIVLAALLGTYVPTDKEQMFRTSVTTHIPDDRHIVVRVTFLRIVWNDINDITTREPLKDPLIYREFFDRLSKSIFLTAQEL